MVGTVGRLTAQPGAGNVIPSSVTVSIDLRHQDDLTRRSACEQLRSLANDIGLRRGVDVVWTTTQEAAAVPTDPHLSELLCRAVSEAGIEAVQLPSGAGHDAAEVAAIAPIAMLFVRCAGGISHHPAESVQEGDVGVAIDVLEKFARSLANEVT
jgi:allantoate deiminase